MPPVDGAAEAVAAAAERRARYQLDSLRLDFAAAALETAATAEIAQPELAARVPVFFALCPVIAQVATPTPVPAAASANLLFHPWFANDPDRV